MTIPLRKVREATAAALSNEQLTRERADALHNRSVAIVERLEDHINDTRAIEKQLWKRAREHEARLDAHTELLNRPFWQRLRWLVIGR